jgi:hypothetical protein
MFDHLMLTVTLGPVLKFAISNTLAFAEYILIASASMPILN